MTSKQLHRKHLTLQEAVDEVVVSKGSEEKDSVILPSVQGGAYAIDVEEDECPKMICFQTMLQEL